jgi:glycosyltransferase involved in cell wall biosynthesis
MASSDSEKLKKSLNIPEDACIVGAVNRLTYQKNPIGLLESFQMALSKNSELHLLLVGDGELMPQVVDFIKERTLENHVTLTGNRKDVPDLLSIMDIFCLPSFWEGLSLGLLEAMAMKRAIIASKVDGTLEVIEHEKSGILIEPGNVDQLAERILELSSNTQLRINLGETAYEKVKRDHSVEHMIETLEEEYHTLNNGSRIKKR